VRQQGVQHFGVDVAGQAADDGFGEQVGARQAAEGLVGDRVGAFARHQHGAVEGELEQVVGELVSSLMYISFLPCLILYSGGWAM
jgi:hypothetical protein